MTAVVIKSPEYSLRNVRTLPGHGQAHYWKVTDGIL